MYGITNIKFILQNAECKPFTYSFIFGVKVYIFLCFADYLTINLVLNQDNKLVSNKKLHLGSATLTAKIHDPSNFFDGSIVHYTWIFNDGSPTQLTTWKNVDHVFRKEGLFLIQVSSNLWKNGRLYSGKKSIYVTLQGTV